MIVYGWNKNPDWETETVCFCKGLEDWNSKEDEIWDEY